MVVVARVVSGVTAATIVAAVLAGLVGVEGYAEHLAAAGYGGFVGAAVCWAVVAIRWRRGRGTRSSDL